MAKEIKVTFTNGGIFEGAANTFTLDNVVTYYFSFDRDYRVTLTSSGGIESQEYRINGAWYTIDIISAVSVSEISGGSGGNVTEDWVVQNFQPKGDYLTKIEASNTYITKVYAEQNFITQLALDETLKQYLKITDYIERMKLYVKRSGDTMTGPLKFPKVWNETINAVGDLLPEVTLNTNGDFNTILSNKNNGFAIYLDENITNKNYFTINLNGVNNDYLIAGLFDSDTTTACIFKLGTSLDTQAATFNILCAGGGSGRQETLIESTSPVYLNNSFGLDGELKIKEYAERAEQADEIDTFITIHPKNATSTNNEYPLISYGSEIINYYLQMGNNTTFSTLNYNGLSASTLLLSSVGNLVINAGNYWSMYSSRCTFYDSDAAYLHNNLSSIKTLVSNSTYLTDLANQSRNLLALAGQTTKLTTVSNSMTGDTTNGYTLIASDTGLKTLQNFTGNNLTLNGHTYAEELEVKINPAAETERDQLEIMCNLFKLCGKGLESLGYEGAGDIIDFTTDTALWYFDNDGKYLLPTTAHIDKLNVSFNK